MASSTDLSSSFRDVRMGTCPEDVCHRRVIFRAPADRVKCRFCSREYAIGRLRDVEAPISADVALQWLQRRASDLEKFGEMGKGRLRLVHRAIDGIGGVVHMLALERYFESYGLNEEGAVVRLSEMGRSEPLNAVTLSDYAFGIREEHTDVLGYGQDRSVATRLAKTIKAVNEANGKRAGDANALEPLQIFGEGKRWFMNAVAAVARACVGREVFLRPIWERIVQHLNKYSDRYKRMTNVSDAEWPLLTYQSYQILSLAVQCSRLPPIPSVVDLAIMANVMCRTILLLDAEPEPTVQAFVPFLRNPGHCVNRKGVIRSPIVLAWSDESHAFKVPMVAVAREEGIDTVWLPREWIKSVWGFPNAADIDTLLLKYLAFDSRGNCAVAQGEYFEPEFLRDCATAFDKFSVGSDGVQAALLGDYAEDAGQGASPGDCSPEVVHRLLDGQLWRCVHCGTVVVGNDDCPVCWHKRNLRTQRVDGTIDYRSGDHTTTSAPDSWCFTKRKHFYDGREYDNPPRKILVQFEMMGKSIEEIVFWFSDESESALNSNAYEIAAGLVRKNAEQGFDFDRTIHWTAQLKAQISQQAEAAPTLEHRLEHLKECLVNVTYGELFDDRVLPVPVKVPITVGQLPMPATARNVIASAGVLYEEFRKQHAEHLEKSGTEKADDLLLALWETDEALTEVEDDIFRGLEIAMLGYDAEDQWRILRAEKSLFADGGLYYTYARRRFRGQKHFRLPLLGERDFAFRDFENAIALCVKGSGHVLVSAKLENTANAEEVEKCGSAERSEKT